MVTTPSSRWKAYIFHLSGGKMNTENKKQPTLDKSILELILMDKEEMDTHLRREQNKIGTITQEYESKPVFVPSILEENRITTPLPSIEEKKLRSYMNSTPVPREKILEEIGETIEPEEPYIDFDLDF